MDTLDGLTNKTAGRIPVRWKRIGVGFQSVYRARANTFDVRDIPPSNRHPKIHAAFEELAAGGTLTIVNDHEPKPLVYEFQAEIEAFDAGGYEVEQRGESEFRPRSPKR